MKNNNIPFWKPEMGILETKYVKKVLVQTSAFTLKDKDIIKVCNLIKQCYSK